jgi:hypothetical protein
VVGATGFEPAASRSRTERSTRLSHAPTEESVYHSVRAAHWADRRRARTGAAISACSWLSVTNAAISRQSMSTSSHRLTHAPRPYGVAKKCVRRTSRATVDGGSLNATDGRARTTSNAQNVVVPARNVGWSHAVSSVTRDRARQSRRNRAYTGRANRGSVVMRLRQIYRAPASIIGNPSTYASASCAVMSGCSGVTEMYPSRTAW